MRLLTQQLDGPHGDVMLGYVEWGAPDAEQVIVCVHGLTRNARDFDVLAAALATEGARVLAIDVVGRGRSSWLADPQGYALPLYAQQIARLLQLLDLPPVDWIGTSMGGLIGMALAATDAPPMRRLVLNDVGPFVPKLALSLIKTYLGLDLVFPSLEALERHLRQIHAPFGPLTDDQWRHLAEHSARQDADGWRLRYDPAIRVPYQDLADADLDLWPLWDQIRCPTLLLRGGDSILLTEATAAEMTQRGPKATLATFPGIGHAPALMAPDQIEAIRRWLAAEPAAM
jgi:pimeloyl-ACP methyl ester carboxylesterase